MDAAQMISPFLRPLYGMRALLLAADSAAPVDPASVVVPGPRPLRVLVLGGGAAMGYGVQSQADALPGRLSHELAAVTGRGVRVDARSRISIPLDRTAELLDGDGVHGYAVVVVTTSFVNASMGLPAATWRRRIRRLVDDLLEQSDPGVVVVLTGLPPADQMEVLAHGLRRALSRSALRVNAALAAVAAEGAGTLYVDLPDLRSAESIAAGQHHDFAGIATVVAAALAPTLLADDRELRAS